MITIDGIDYYKMEEASKKMGVSYNFLQQQRKKGKIGSTQDGKCIWISSQHIKEYFDRYDVKPKTSFRIIEKKQEGIK